MLAPYHFGDKGWYVLYDVSTPNEEDESCVVDVSVTVKY
jgi:hypothetical protein